MKKNSIHLSIKRALVIGTVSILLCACGGSGGDPSAQTPAPNSPVVVQPARLLGGVSDAKTGAALVGVEVRVGTLSTQTIANGSYELGVGTGQLIVSFTKPGYAVQTKVTTDLVRQGDSSYLNVPLLPYAASQVLSGTAAQTVTVPGSTASVALPVDAMRRADGSAPQGAVTVNLTPIDPSSNINVMPGSLVTLQSGSAVPIESFGALNVTIVDATGAELNLGSGKVATIRIPAVSRGAALPATIPLFHFSTVTGQWLQEGTATLFGSGATAYYEGTVTHFSTWNADRVVDTVFINSCVVDGANARVVGARVASEGIDYVGSAGTLTDALGNFRIAVKKNARVALTASANGLVGTSTSIATYGVDQTIATCLRLTPAAVTIKLTWGALPYDLDSHLYAPGASGSPVEVYWINKGSLLSAPYANLDVDDTSSFGPEYITIARIAKNSRYRYWVNNYSRSFTPGQIGSPARVELNIRGALTVFTPPADEGTNRDWHAFDLAVDNSCNISVLPVNSWSTPTPPAAIGTPDYCN